MITEADPDLMNDSELAIMGKRLAQALSDLRQMKKDMKDATKELKEGIDDQQKEVERLASLIRTGQKELFPGLEKKHDGFEEFRDGVKRAAQDEGVKRAIQKLQNSVPNNCKTSITVEGQEPVVIGDNTGNDDELLQDAIKLVRECAAASTTILQKRLGVGYGRAAHLIDLMEQQGVVGPAEGAKPRTILKLPDGKSAGAGANQ